MKKINIERGLICECLIDQKRFIGDAPVGHACCNLATRKVDTGKGQVYFCDSCIDMLSKEPERVDYIVR